MPDFALENEFWDAAETMPDIELRNLQLARLNELVARVAHVPFYKEAFAAHGVSAGQYPHARRPAPASVHHQGGPAPALSAGVPGGPARAGGPLPWLLGHNRQAHIRSLYAKKTWSCGRTCARASCTRAVCARATRCTLPSATGCSRADLACTTASKRSARPFCPRPRATRRARSCCCRISTRMRSFARQAMRSI
jgi:hypothetical protein